MGTGGAGTARLCAETPSPDPRRSNGGQASGPGLFGLRITGGTGSVPVPSAVRPVQQATQARPADSLSFGHHQAIVCRPSPVEIEARNAAMRAAALASDLRQEREWHEYAELVEFNPTLPYGGVETACALND